MYTIQNKLNMHTIQSIDNKYVHYPNTSNLHTFHIHPAYMYTVYSNHAKIYINYIHKDMLGLATQNYQKNELIHLKQKTQVIALYIIQTSHKLKGKVNQSSTEAPSNCANRPLK